MKPLISYMKQSKGFVLGYTMLLGALVLTVITAIVYLLPSRTATTLHLKHSTKALFLAESGIQHALSQIRQHATRTEGLADIDSIKLDNNRFKYSYHVELSTITLPQLYEQLIVSATAEGMVTVKQSNKTTTRYVYTLIEVNTLSDYFEICTKTLKIGRGLDISDADIYGYKLEFLETGSDEPTRVRKADYSQGTPLNHKEPWVIIGGIPGGGAYKRQMKIDLPLLSEIIDVYKELASKTTTYTTNSSGLLGESNCTNGYTATLSGDIYPPLNGNGIYYSPSTINIGDPVSETKIHGQIVFVTTHTINILGSLKKSSYAIATWPADYPIVFASIPVPTSLLGLMSGSNIYVNKTISNVAQTITIQALIFASEGRFTVANNVEPSLDAVFTFFGAIMMRDGIFFGHIFKPENRNYSYDQDLKNYGLPHMPYQANIIYYHSG